MSKKFYVFVLFLFLLFKTPSYIQAAYVNLAWDPPVEGGAVQGYIVYWSITSGSYDYIDSIKVIGKTSATVSELDESRNHYFIVKAYNAAGTGPASNEVFLEAYSIFFHDDSSNEEAYDHSSDDEIIDNSLAIVAYDDSLDDEIIDDSLDNVAYDDSSDDEIIDDSSDDEVSRKVKNGNGCFIATAAIGL